MITTVIAGILTSDVGLSALIGDRVYGVYAPNDVVSPYVVLLRREMTVEDGLHGPTALRMAEFDISVYADTVLDVEEVEEAVIAAMTLSNYDSTDLLIQSSNFNMSSTGVIPQVDGSADPEIVSELEYQVNYLVK